MSPTADAHDPAGDENRVERLRTRKRPAGCNEPASHSITCSFPVRSESVTENVCVAHLAEMKQFLWTLCSGALLTLPNDTRYSEMHKFGFVPCSFSSRPLQANAAQQAREQILNVPHELRKLISPEATARTMRQVFNDDGFLRCNVVNAQFRLSRDWVKSLPVSDPGMLGFDLVFETDWTVKPTKFFSEHYVD